VTSLSLAFIGTGNAFVPEGMCWNGFIAADRLLFEAPPSALMAVRRMGLDPDAIDTVLISHHHGDHFLGLPMLLLHWKYFGRRSRVTVAGPAGTMEHARTITDLVYPGVFDEDLPVDWVTVRAGERLALRGTEVEAFAMKHDTRLDCLGFRASLEEGTVGYTGDTAFCDSVPALARGADLLVAECTSVADPSEIHMNLGDIRRLRETLGPAPPILLTHLTRSIPDPGIAGVRAAEDFAVYRFPARTAGR